MLPRFVAFAWRYHRCDRGSSPPAPDAEPWINRELVGGISSRLARWKRQGLPSSRRNPRSERVRTKNHVERTNRMFRFLEKVRYKWRRRQTLVRFVVFKLDEVWSGWEHPQGPRDQSTEISQTSRNATPSQTKITTSCVRIRWRLARSVHFPTAGERRRSLIPKVGLEPTRVLPHRILSPARLPFRHFGINTIPGCPTRWWLSTPARVRATT